MISGTEYPHVWREIWQDGWDGEAYLGQFIPHIFKEKFPDREPMSDPAMNSRGFYFSVDYRSWGSGDYRMIADANPPLNWTII